MVMKMVIIMMGMKIRAYLCMYVNLRFEEWSTGRDEGEIKKKKSS